MAIVEKIGEIHTLYRKRNFALSMCIVLIVIVSAEPHVGCYNSKKTCKPTHNFHSLFSPHRVVGFVAS
jgi:hypothetical protein